MDFEEILKAEQQKYQCDDDADDVKDGTKHLSELNDDSAYKKWMKSFVSTNSELEAKAQAKRLSGWVPRPDDVFYPGMPWGIGCRGQDIGPEITRIRGIPDPLEAHEFGSVVIKPKTITKKKKKQKEKEKEKLRQKEKQKEKENKGKKEKKSLKSKKRR